MTISPKYLTILVLSVFIVGLACPCRATESSSFSELVIGLVKSGYTVNYDVTTEMANLHFRTPTTSPADSLKTASIQYGFTYNIYGRVVEIVDHRILDQGAAIPSNRKIPSVFIHNQPLTEAVSTLDPSFSTNSFFGSTKIGSVSLKQEHETTVRKVIWALVNQTGRCAAIITSRMGKGYHSIYGDNLSLVEGYAPITPTKNVD